jgi:hypothetical protein
MPKIADFDKMISLINNLLNSNKKGMEPPIPFIIITFFFFTFRTFCRR